MLAINKGKWTNMTKKISTIVWTILLTIFILHNVLENAVHAFRVFDEIIALLSLPLAVYDYLKNKRAMGVKVTKTKKAELILLAAFLLCGLTGNVIYKFQPTWVVAFSAVLAAKFFMILLSAGYIQKFLQVNLEEQGLVVCGVSISWFLYFVISLLLPDIFPALAAWDICAKSSLLFALLIFCEHRKVWLYRVCLILMLAMLLLSGKEKAYGAILVFGLFYYLIVHRKIQTKVRYILYMAIPIVILAWDKIYYYYVEGNGRYAKSIMTSTSLQIAKDYFPIGTGFGTFGSNYAKEVYSPVYHLYGIASNGQLGVESKQYLTDLFWPILFGETGVLGTIIYCGLIILLFVQIQRVFFYNKKKYLLLIFMYVFMLMTTFTEAGFMQPMVMVFAFIMGMVLQEYEEKRKQKMKYFE